MARAQGKHFKEFVKGYLEAALWTSTDESDESGGEPLDKNHDIDDLADKAVESMKKDCSAFFRAERRALNSVTKKTISWDRAGHDFWLTRNGHGAGFWDEYYGDDKKLRDAFKKLTDASHAYGSSYLFVGDNGRIYVS